MRTNPPAGLVQIETTDLRRNQARIPPLHSDGLGKWWWTWKIWRNVTWNFRRDKLNPCHYHIFFFRSKARHSFRIFWIFGFLDSLDALCWPMGIAGVKKRSLIPRLWDLISWKGQVVWSLDWEVILWAPPRLFWSGKDIKHAKQM